PPSQQAHIAFLICPQPGEDPFDIPTQLGGDLILHDRLIAAGHRVSLLPFPFQPTSSSSSTFTGVESPSDDQSSQDPNLATIDVLLLKSAWEYHLHGSAFLDWIKRLSLLSAASVPVCLNPLSV